MWFYKMWFYKILFFPKIIITATKKINIYLQRIEDKEWTISKYNNNKDKFLFIFNFFEKPDKDWPWSYVFPKENQF